MFGYYVRFLVSSLPSVAGLFQMTFLYFTNWDQSFALIHDVLNASASVLPLFHVRIAHAGAVIWDGVKTLRIGNGDCSATPHMSRQSVEQYRFPRSSIAQARLLDPSSIRSSKPPEPARDDQIISGSENLKVHIGCISAASSQVLATS